MSEVNKVAMLVGGIAGAGVVSVGTMIAKCFQSAGLHVFAEKDYPSLIRGGHNFYVVRAEDREVHAALETVDVVIAFNEETITKHTDRITPQGALIYDGEKMKDVKISRKDIHVLDVPLERFAKESGGLIYFNVVAMASALSLVDMPLKIIHDVLENMFGRKGAEIVDANMKAAKMGYEFAHKHCPDFKNKITQVESKDTVYVSGNEAACIGAVKAGVKLVAEYPMTPSSSVLHFMAAHEESFNIVVKHTEDELAAINMVAGAAFAGVRTLTATSGGGFSLMVEGLGMIGLMEQPLVLIESQRSGPSTGMPTYHEQGDLKFAINASQGEFPLIVLTPGDMVEAYNLTAKAFNMAEQYQCPVIVLMDKFISESNMTVDVAQFEEVKINRGKLMSDEQMKIATEFKRHEVTEDGISPRCRPGQPNGRHVCSSYEHDETGFTTEDPDERVRQVDKRARKLLQIPEEELAPVIIGDNDAPITLVGYGSTLLVAKEALRFLNGDGIKVRYVHFRAVQPFPVATVTKELSKPGKYCVAECNSTAQLRGLIRENTGIFIEDTLLRYDGRTFTPEQFYAKMKEMHNG